MRKIESLELEKWSEPDETGHVHLVGMEKAQVAFDRLEAHLKDVGMMPDEYFLFNDSRFKNDDTLPWHRGVLCNVEFGASEGIYLDICLLTDHKPVQFATGKTLREDADAFLWMHRIAAECSLMLNGGGRVYTMKELPVLLTEEEAGAVYNSVDLDLCNPTNGEEERLLVSAHEKLAAALGRDIQLDTPRM